MGGTPEERLLSVQLYLAFNAATGLLLGAAYTEAKSAEARVRALGDNLPQGAVYQVMRERDGGKRFLYMSAGIQELTGIAADKMLRDASAFYRLMLEEDRPAFAAAEEAAVRDLTVFQSVFRLRRRDGQVRWVQATSSPRLLGDGRVIWDGIQTDVTEHTQAVDDLRNSEARFRTLTEDAPIAICVAREARLVYVNPTFLKMFRFKSMSECLGRPALDFHAPQCRPEIAERMARRAAGLPEPREYESLGARGDGSEFPIMVAVLRMQFGEGPAMVAFITDLTARRQSEEERTRLEQQLRQAQKLESLGRLAGGVSHDFNNLLTVINGFSMLLTQKLDAHERVWSYAEQIRRAGERAASLTGQLLAFSRQEAIQPVPLNLNATIADSEQMFRSLVGEGISLTTHLDAHLGAVLADPAQIDQILLNLVVNARDAMPDGGSLMIATVNFDGAVRNDSAGEAPSCGRWVTVTIADTGIGMDEHTRQNIFEPFFTTKGVGKGTGLGLSTVYGAMQQNGGWIDVNSQPGAGSSFRLYFPRIDDQPLPPAREIPHSREAHTGGTVLLVEDEAAVRDFLRVVLEDCHYKVLEARNGVEALAVAAEEIDGIHLLVADVVMPGMNGRELAERLRRDRPALKAIFMSGHSTDVIAHSGALDDDAAFLQKPVSPDALAAKVRDVLAGG
jgi:PAS domain S-box-containing protein